MESKQISFDGEDEHYISFAHNIRRKVFVEEQNVSLKDEIDGMDKHAHHILYQVNDQQVGQCRILIKDNIVKIGRLAILKEHRGKHQGQDIMNHCKEIVLKNESFPGEIQLGAQTHAIGFQKKLGQEEFGDQFMDAGIEHVMMNLKVK